MSSFIVSDSCMRNIIYGLFWSHEFKHMYGHLLDSRGYYESAGFDKLAQKFWKLNYDAVNYCYQRDLDWKEKKGFKWDHGTTNKYQVLKSMHCLKYQCSEGNIPKRKDYKYLVELIRAWESFIIMNISEYEKAKWD